MNDGREYPQPPDRTGMRSMPNPARTEPFGEASSIMSIRLDTLEETLAMLEDRLRLVLVDSGMLAPSMVDQSTPVNDEPISEVVNQMRLNADRVDRITSQVRRVIQRVSL